MHTYICLHTFSRSILCPPFLLYTNTRVCTFSLSFGLFLFRFFLFLHTACDHICSDFCMCLCLCVPNVSLCLCHDACSHERVCTCSNLTHPINCKCGFGQSGWLAGWLTGRQVSSQVMCALFINVRQSSIEQATMDDDSSVFLFRSFVRLIVRSLARTLTRDPFASP